MYFSNKGASDALNGVLDKQQLQKLNYAEPRVTRFHQEMKQNCVWVREDDYAKQKLCFCGRTHTPITHILNFAGIGEAHYWDLVSCSFVFCRSSVTT